MRILFVDDEPNVLSGIRRMLRTMRNTWDMEFVASGAEAIARIEEQPFDVVVSDMRMPGMDGAELLSVIKEKLPGAVRIALSGETDQNMVYRCVQHAHQYLSKPCEPSVLTDTVKRACHLQEMLQDQRLSSLVSGLSSIPSLPEQYTRIMDELQSEDASLQKIGEIVESDVAMTAKILQLVNSTFFGLVQHVESPAQATMLLGVDVIRTLVLSSGVFSQFDAGVSKHFDLRSIWSRSAKVAALARAIALQQTGDKTTADYAFMGGMMIDIGQFVLASNTQDELDDAWRGVLDTGAADWQCERHVFGYSHMEIGAYLVGLWGLPNPIVETVAFHHIPANGPVGDFTPLTAAHAALAVVSAEGATELPDLDQEYIDQLGLIDSIPEWRSLYAEMFSNDEATQ